MFGHQNDDQDNKPEADEQPTSAPEITDTDVSEQASSAVSHDYLHPDGPVVAPAADADTDDSVYLPPTDSTFTPPPATEPPIEPTAIADATPAAADDDASDDETPAVAADTNDLLDIKQKALGQLSPLVGHLEQTPVEKFRTTMMMIQASDNQSLIKDAYAAAQSIEDEKTKAQALLDVINEINYFTQHHDS